MAKKTHKVDRGIKLKKEDLTTNPLTEQGELATDSNDNKLKYRDDSATREIADTDSAQTVTNKTIDADNNTISNLETDNLKAGVLVTDVSTATSNTELPSALAVKTALEAQDAASEISYNPAGNPETTATELQTALDDTGTAVGTAQSTADDHIADTVDAHESTAIGYTPNGTKTIDAGSIEVSAALGDLDDETDSLRTLTNTAKGDNNMGTFSGTTISDNATLKAGMQDLETAHETHTGASAAHGTTGDLVGTTDTQTITNKTIDADNNTISNLAHGAEVDNPTSGVHGVTGSVVGTSDAQVLTAKDIDGGTASNTSRITIPKATKATLDGLTRKEATIVYASDEDKGYLDDGTNLIELGAGASGSGGINYIDNSDFELGIDGWNLYDDGAADVPVDGTGGTASFLQLISNTYDGLRGAKTLNIRRNSGGSAQGEGASYDFSIDKADQARKLIISFDYESTGTFADGDMRVFIYDVSNAQLIRVNGEDVSAGKGTHYAQFQTAPDSTNYRLILHNTATGTGLTISFNIDNVKVGPQVISHGTIKTDTVSYSPTGSLTTNATYSGQYYRDGEYLFGEVMISFIGANTENVNATIDIPSGLSIDTSKLIESSDKNFLDNGSNLGDNSNGNFACSLVYSDTNSLGITYLTDNATVERWQTLNPNTSSPFVIASGDKFLLKYKVPIQGWSSNAKMSEDFSGRDVVYSGRPSGAQAITTSTFTTIVMQTNRYDSTGSMNTSTGVYTVPESGRYKIDMGVALVAVTTDQMQCGININSLGNTNIAQNVFTNTSGSTQSLSTSGIYDLAKGDTVEAQVWHDHGTNLNTNLDRTYLTIQKLASPQTILENETVAARYTSNSGQTVSNSNNIVYEDLVSDTHNSYNASTGVYTIPVTGWYKISAKTRTSTAGNTTIAMDINGSNVSYTQNNTAGESLLLSEEVELVKGDTIQIANESGANRTLTADGRYNIFSIARIK